MGFKFTLGHHSSCVDYGSLRDGFRDTADLTGLASWTEVGSDDRSATLADEAAKNGYGYWRPDEWGPDECALTFKKSSWTLTDTAVKQLTSIRWTGGDDQENRPLFANAVRLTHRSDGYRLIYSYAHMPSHVYTCSDGWYSNSKAKAYKDGLPTWAKWLKSLDDQWGQTALVVAADWNMDMACKGARTYHENTWPEGYKVAAKNDNGWPDTHDTRTLDWFILGGAVSKSGPIRAYDMPDSDHKTVIATFTT